MVLVSVQSVESENGYDYRNDFPEALVIDPNSRVQVVSFQFTRTQKFVVDDTCDSFQVKLNQVNGNLILIRLDHGNYTGRELATEINRACNAKLAATGHHLNFEYNDKDGNFTASSFYVPVVLPSEPVPDMDLSQGSELTYTAGSGEVSCTGITDGTSNYAKSKDSIALLNLPPNSAGGSYAEMRLDNDLPTPGADDRGVCMGFQNPRDATQPTQGAKLMGAPASNTWMFCGLVAYRRAGGSRYVDIYEDGNKINPVSIPFTTSFAQTTFRIYFASDNEFPQYYFKPQGGTAWRSLNANLQSVVSIETDVIGNTLDFIVGADNSAVNELKGLNYTPEPNANLSPQTDYWLTPQGGTLTKTDYQRSYNAGAGDGVANSTDVGLLSKVVSADEYGELTFEYNAVDGSSLLIGVADAQTVADNTGAGANLFGDCSAQSGVMADGGGLEVANPDKYPFVGMVRLDGSNSTATARDNVNLNAVNYSNTNVKHDISDYQVANAGYRIRVFASSGFFQVQATKDATEQNPTYDNLYKVSLPNKAVGNAFADDMGTSSANSTNGWQFFILSQNWVGAGSTATQPVVQNLVVSLSQSTTAPENWINMYPNLNLLPDDTPTFFGDLIGFPNRNYLFSGSTGITQYTGGNPNPEASTNVGAHSDFVQINVPTLQVKSLVGQKLQKSATINSAPVGSLTGKTRMVGQVPRFNDGNGDNCSHNFGPFYYDYFPYSVPLHNASEYNINELHIQIVNSDGTLATDIAKSSLVLSMDNLESEGESKFMPTIGAPMPLKQTKEQINNLKSQMRPSLD